MNERAGHSGAAEDAGGMGGAAGVFGAPITLNDVARASGVVRGVEDVATRAGYQMILCNTDEDPQKELTYLRMLRSKGVDGALMVPTGVRHDYLDHLVQAAFPLVIIDRVQRGGIPSQRLQGYRDALREHGIGEDLALIRDANARREEGFEQTVALLDLAEPPTAIFSTHNLTTIGALAALDAQGRRIPDDVAVVGFGDFEWAPLMRPRLTTVVQPEHAAGARAADLLIDRIERRSGEPPRRVVLPVQLAVRESCGASGYSRVPDLERLFGRVAAEVIEAVAG